LSRAKEQAEKQVAEMAAWLALYQQPFGNLSEGNNM